MLCTICYVFLSVKLNAKIKSCLENPKNTHLSICPRMHMPFHNLFGIKWAKRMPPSFLDSVKEHRPHLRRQ